MRDSGSCGGKRSHHTLSKAEIDEKVIEKGHFASFFLLELLLSLCHDHFI